jgi:hypothetical protein
MFFVFLNNKKTRIPASLQCRNSAFLFLFINIFEGKDKNYFSINQFFLNKSCDLYVLFINLQTEKYNLYIKYVIY